MTQPVRTVRRHRDGPSFGDVRRRRLLDALETFLDERPLAEIGISEITRSAGVTRSAFYFYFPSKAAAVAALLGDIYENVFRVASWFDSRGGQPLDELRTGIEATIAMWRSRPGVMVAMLDAVGTDPDIRAVWTGWLDEFEKRAAGRLSSDQAHGIVRSDIDLATLTRVLVGATFHAMDRDVRDIRSGIEPRPDLATAIFEIWRRTAYHP